MTAIYHVTTRRKLERYEANGDSIAPPVRAWKNIEAAERFSKQTGRRLIIRLTLDSRWEPFEGHRGEAVICHHPVKLRDA